MASFDHRNLLDRAVGVCLTILAGAAALYIAVRLIEAIWVTLLIILAIAGAVAVAIAVIRYRSNGW
jgi:hypothetical protein